jgi:hypothetical protein
MQEAGDEVCGNVESPPVRRGVMESGSVKVRAEGANVHHLCVAPRVAAQNAAMRQVPAVHTDGRTNPLAAAPLPSRFGI